MLTFENVHLKCTPWHPPALFRFLKIRHWVSSQMISEWQQFDSEVGRLRQPGRATCVRVRSYDGTAASVQRCEAALRPAAAAGRASRPFRRHWTGTRTGTYHARCAETCARRRRRRRSLPTSWRRVTVHWWRSVAPDGVCTPTRTRSYVL